MGFEVKRSHYFSFLRVCTQFDTKPLRRFCCGMHFRYFAWWIYSTFYVLQLQLCLQHIYNEWKSIWPQTTPMNRLAYKSYHIKQQKRHNARRYKKITFYWAFLSSCKVFSEIFSFSIEIFGDFCSFARVQLQKAYWKANISMLSFFCRFFVRMLFWCLYLKSSLEGGGQLSQAW